METWIRELDQLSMTLISMDIDFIIIIVQFLSDCFYYFFLFFLQLTGDSQNFSSQENDTLPQLLSMYSLYLYFLFFSFISFGIST